MKTLEEIKAILENHKERIRSKYGVILIGIFGSCARGEQRETSDVDILVELERPVGLEFFELWNELEKLLGCEVDLVREKLVRDELREEILKGVVRI